MDCVSEEDFARFRGAVDAYYALIDKLLGQWMRRARGGRGDARHQLRPRLQVGRRPPVRALVAEPVDRGLLAPARRRLRGLGRAGAPRAPAGHGTVLRRRAHVAALPAFRSTAPMRGAAIRSRLHGSAAAAEQGPVRDDARCGASQAEAMSAKDAERVREAPAQPGLPLGRRAHEARAHRGLRVPASPRAGWNNLGVYLRENRRNFKAAEAAFRKALELRPAIRVAAVQPGGPLPLARRGREGDRLALPLARRPATPTRRGRSCAGSASTTTREDARARECSERGTARIRPTRRIARELGLVRFKAKDCAGAWDAVERFEPAHQGPGHPQRPRPLQDLPGAPGRGAGALPEVPPHQARAARGRPAALNLLNRHSLRANDAS